MSIAIPLWPFVTVTLAIIIIFVLDSHRRKRHYPPGPKPRLFVGNLFDIPTIEPWKVYNDWRKFYGALIHLEIIGYHIVVVNSRTLADRMLEKRSKIYSDRPFIPMMDLMGWTTLNTALLRYGPDWRMHRRLYKQGFRAAVVPDYQPILFSKADQFSSNLRQSPDSFVAHTRTYAAATILATVYGYDISPSNDKLVEIAEQAAATSSDSFHPSSVVVNVLPFLRHLPLRFPIFAFQRIARRTRRILNEMRKLPYEFVKNDMVTGKDNFSLLAKFLEKHTVNGGDDHQEDLIRNALTTAYAAGAETTSSVLVTFFLAMGLHPDIQKRAQREIDTVIGNRQFPSYATDYSNLPYVEAILRETLRWSPVTPLGIPHTAFLDDTIDDYFIPKGTTVISNIW
ncbi:hypothetical protein E1B28_011237 [Marasmius oreades]|nr:uncharacterized protein E1B28_011237 [Marasmius oreades]KAG7089567.1 hypothetical protein E1B28_011237 [Marasmius oreades]